MNSPTWNSVLRTGGIIYVNRFDCFESYYMNNALIVDVSGYVLENKL